MSTVTSLSWVFSKSAILNHINPITCSSVIVIFAISNASSFSYLFHFQLHLHDADLLETNCHKLDWCLYKVKRYISFTSLHRRVTIHCHDYYYHHQRRPEHRLHSSSCRSSKMQTSQRQRTTEMALNRFQQIER